MKAPPPTPELCGSTSESIACTATAASTALPPRFSTLRPAWAASGLAAMTNGPSVAATGGAAGALAQEPRAMSARAERSLLNGRIPDRLAEEEWRFKSIPLRSRAGELGFKMARQLEHFENLVSLFLTRAEAKGEEPFLWAKRGGEWRSISWAETARQVAALAASLRRIGLERGDRVCLVSE